MASPPDTSRRCPSHRCCSRQSPLPSPPDIAHPLALSVKSVNVRHRYCGYNARSASFPRTSPGLPSASSRKRYPSTHHCRNQRALTPPLIDSRVLFSGDDVASNAMPAAAAGYPLNCTGIFLQGLPVGGRAWRHTPVPDQQPPLSLYQWQTLLITRSRICLFPLFLFQLARRFPTCPSPSVFRPAARYARPN